MFEHELSPKYIMQLIPKIEAALWELFDTSKYKNVRRYIDRWHKSEGNDWNDYWENFQIILSKDEPPTIDLPETLHKMPEEILIRIAIDLGIDTPGFLPVVPQFKNVLKDQNQSAYQNFERATKDAHDNPDQAVSLSSSTLEGIIKTILTDSTIKSRVGDANNKSLTKLISAIVKAFDLDDDSKCPQELITIASQLRGLGKAIDDLRSDKSSAHGKAHDEYVVDDPLWAVFIINTSASLGMFLWEYYVKKFKPTAGSEEPHYEGSDEKTISLDDIPF